MAQLLEFGKRDPTFERYSLLFLMAYAFLLRVPSEAIPATAYGNGPCRLSREGPYLVLHLDRRKNKPSGSRLVRGCWCKECPRTCPIHVLGPLLDATAPGELLFPEVTAASALHTLRSMLRVLGKDRWHEYRTHDFRRGHAKDLQLSGEAVPAVPKVMRWSSLLFGLPGAPLWQILAAGEWKSPAFLLYLDMHKLESELVVQAHVDESDGEDSEEQYAAAKSAEAEAVARVA